MKDVQWRNGRVIFLKFSKSFYIIADACRSNLQLQTNSFCLGNFDVRNLLRISIQHPPFLPSRRSFGSHLESGVIAPSRCQSSKHRRQHASTPCSLRTGIKSRVAVRSYNFVRVGVATTKFQLRRSHRKSLVIDRIDISKNHFTRCVIYPY